MSLKFLFYDKHEFEVLAVEFTHTLNFFLKREKKLIAVMLLLMKNVVRNKVIHYQNRINNNQL